MSQNIFKNTDIDGNPDRRTEESGDLQTLDHLEFLLDNTSDHIWVIDRQFRVIYMNESFRLCYKKTFDVSLQKGDNLLDPILDTSVRAVWQDRYERVFNGEQLRINDPLQIQCESHHVEITLNPILVGDDVARILCISHDITSLKSTEANLERSEFAADRFPIGMVWLESSGRFSYVNDAFAKLVGYSKGDLLTMSAHQVNPGFSPESWPAHVELVKKESRLVFESVLKTKEAVLVPVEIHANYFDLGRSEEGMLCGGIIDIRERKRVEDSLRESEARAKAILNSSFQLQGLLQTDGALLVANTAALTMAGVELEEIAGKAFWDCPWWTHDAALQGLLKNAVERASKGEVVQFYTEHVTPAGDVRHVDFRMTPILNSDGDVAFLVPEGHDITELKTAQVALERYKKILDATSDMVGWADAEERVLYTNPAGRKLLGLPDSIDISTKRISDFFSQDTYARMKQDTMQRAIRDGIWSGESELVSTDGKTIPVSQVQLAHKDSEGNVEGLSTICRDLTEQKHHERLLKEAKKAAESANKAKSVFLANMSHEIRTPMNAVLGYAQLLQRDRSLSNQQRKNVDAIDKAGEHLLTLIDSVLEMSKIEAGRVELEPSVFDLHELLSELETLFVVRTDRMGLELFIERAADVPQFVEADEGKIRQVLINLLGNAVKFTKCGAIKVIASVAKANDEVLTDDELLTLSISVSDTGIGIAPEELHTVFGAFDQAEGGRDLNVGTGLGLTISREFAHMMAGDLVVTSKLGQGSTFTFTFTARPAEVACVTPAAPQRRVIGLADGQPAIKVLVVDDRDYNRDILVKLLEPIGFDVETADNGESGVEAFKRFAPQVVLMDIRMPIMDGVEASRRIRDLPGGKSIAIIAISASALTEQRIAVLKRGADAFVRKPFREAEVFAAIAKHAGIRYAYENEGTSAEPSNTAQVDLTKDQLAVLPSEILMRIAQAAQTGDLDALELLTKQVADQDAGLGVSMGLLVEEFEYARIIELVTASLEERAGTVHSTEGP